MACTAALSGRATFTFCRVNTSSRTHQRRQQACVVRCSLQDEFKRQLLGLSNGTAGSPAERRKDLSASTSGRVGGADVSAAASSSSSQQQQPPTSQQQQPTQQPPSSSQQAGLQPPPAPESEHAGTQEQPGERPALGNPLLPLLPLGEEPGYHPLEFCPSSQIELDWGVGGADEPWLGPSALDRSRCFVILFGVGRAETEGIYSLRAVAKDDGLPVDTIVAFEAEDDAMRYATLLEATMDHEPTVWPIEWGELLEFCTSAGYRCRLEPAGSLLIPPDYNVGMTDWEKSLKLRKGEFSVLGAEPSSQTAPTSQSTLFPPGWAYEAFDAPWASEQPAQLQDEDELAVAQLSAIIDSQLSSEEALARMKASFERLLPQDE
ncbi:hypothetical protein C2E20_5127 [Micractinium conductrix]|uniref:Uncharacterized protein n=1 Tax=Micractinium conductrix TaxID=554055 RepID=A0A2P6VBT6_9CHLO|nr:hypothetical protein C2E20_5127 [Micractinium conductrix]|eukprot:PSC71555.1 hypothetical protein C2E20_5127 [Micractinium conductrix]